MSHLSTVFRPFLVGSIIQLSDIQFGRETEVLLLKCQQLSLSRLDIRLCQRLTDVQQRIHLSLCLCLHPCRQSYQQASYQQ